ncbi:MAG: tRNA (N(6)-L-threonylcarbamoyladenosine(37)-C(2))-methylthiotransferase MtaB [Bacteroidales bacterium]|nr:tRNA (N(6)-L-threonylcarbamoyladenosine(37)-C(2))-methylthiotransferase MtaB [Bacteroidales bacterium]MBR5396506.1 tRNA (N(6)-L-threonylcarbamoyladenosine(37)-C(2))-methylthiotransferase MtaB [Bacteroidales bacterium]
MRIAFLTLGCKLNYAETSTYERGFVRNGLEVVPWEDKADVYLVNTCSVTERAEKKCRNIIRKMHRTAPEAKLIVTGCYAELRREELLDIEGVSLVFGAQEKSLVVARTLKMLGITPLQETSVRQDVLEAYSSEERTRSFLKVQDGCNNFCAYCTVPFARGLSRNIPIDDVIAQARQIASTGIKEIVITGVNTGDFGRTTGESFLELLKRLDDVEGIERYRISSIEPNLITEDIVDWIASGNKFQPHFHIPLQTGSDTLLKRVGRKYTTEFFADRIEYIRSRMDPRPGTPEGNLKPFVFFGIDVIAGLPGETEELFGETCSFLEERIKPAFIHIFPYSRRPGTAAASWKDQVKDSVKTERVARLEELSDRLHADFISRNRGRHSQVLWESDCKNGMMGGFTGNYIRLERPYDPDRVNTIEDIVI